MNEFKFRLVVEDELTELIVYKVFKSMPAPATIINCYRKNGIGYVKNNIMAFARNAAQDFPCLALVDLDREGCAPDLIRKWQIVPASDHLMFRVAVRETETWLLADRKRFASWFKIPVEKIPLNAEAITDPKQFIVNLVRKHGDRILKRNIVPDEGSSAPVGKSFSSAMIQFAHDHWNVDEARKRADSLDRFIRAVEKYMEKYR